MAKKLEIPTIRGQKRDARGKTEIKRLRAEEKVPGNYYYLQEEPVALTFEEADVRKLLSKRRGLIEIKWGDKEEEKAEVLLREVQRHPVTQKPLHLDFVGITRGQKIYTTVPIRLLGQPIGVKDQGGILQQVMNQVDISCMPRHLIEVVDVDVTGLELGDSLHLSDIEVENVEWEDIVERTVATVVIPRILEEETEEEDEELLEGAELAEGEEGEGEGEEGGEEAEGEEE